MSDLATFTKHLKEKHENELARRLEIIEKQADNKKQEAIKQLNDKLAKDMRDIDDMIASAQHIDIQKIRNQSRNQVLVEKQNLMLTIFDEAVSRLGQLSTEQLEQFFNAIVKQLPQDKEYVVTCGELTPVQWVIPNHMTLSDATLSQQGGFVFSSNGVSYNFLFQTLVNDLKQTYLSELLQSLQQ